MTLDELTALESEWMDKHPYGRVRGDDLEEACEREGVFAAWRMIFREYVALAKQGNLEALKRGVFLWWYECAEPNRLSGIRGLDKQLGKEVFGMLDEMVRQDELDTELQYMPPWYYAIADFYLDAYDGFDPLKKYSREADSQCYWELCPHSSFDNRGQMGKYWIGLQKGLHRDWGDMGAHL